MLDLHEDFPQLAPSAVAKVLDALSERDLVRRAGDPAQIYVGGVEFWPASRSVTEEDEELRELTARLEEAGWSARPDHERGLIVVALPIEDVNEALIGLANNRFDALQALIHSFEEEAAIAWTSISSELAIAGGTPSLQVELGLRGPTTDELDHLGE